MNSARDLEEYFLNPKKFGLPAENLLNLFNSEKNFSDIDNDIGEFLERRTSELKESGHTARDLLVYFVGHGGFTSSDDYYLAIRRTGERNPMSSAILIRSLAFTLKERARFLRRIIILDSCFAGAAYQSFQKASLAEGPSKVALKQTFDEFKVADKGVGLPGKGTSILCASSHKDRARSLSLDEKHTLFSGALLHVLNTGDKHLPQEYLSLSTVARLIRDYLTTTYGGTAPIPADDSPDQSEGKVAEVPIFPNLARRIIQDTSKKFEPLDDTIQCCVIVSETEEKRSSSESLKSIVRRMLIKYGKRIGKIAGQSVHEVPYVMNVTEIISSKENYKNAIIALCRSSIAIFDVTNYEPAVMLLLGIRSVVRRGVTILSAGGEYTIDDPLEAPFNIKEVNVVSHSDKERLDPIDPIGSRIVEGFKQLLRLSHYLDLPSFDAIRTLPPDFASQRLKDYTEQVLILCPFGKEYRKLNWELHLRRNLGIYIQNRESEELDEEQEPPDLVRTLDIKSPRLVSQMLYETIRATSMCIVDWTTWRPNVFFELGVRLAASDIPPICIIEDTHEALVEELPKKTEELQSIIRPMGVSPDDLARFNWAASQCNRLLVLFKPIVYKAPEGGDPDESAYIKMVDYYKKLVSYVNGKDGTLIDAQQEEELVGSLPADYTYEIVTEWIDWKVETAAKPVYSELIEAANLLDSSDIDSGGRSPVLYPKNETLDQKAEEGARERRLAAWYYIEKRYRAEDIIRDPKLAQSYERLGNALARSLKRSSNKDDQSLADTILAQVEKFTEWLKKRENANE